ncbi:MAG TPA: ABC transporter permease [Thermoanaerobaculia bacterium]
MGTLFQDLRYALRTLAKSPAFTTAAVATLALGIGVNTAIFSVINGLLLKPLPGTRDPRELIRVSNVVHGQKRLLSYPDYVDDRDSGIFSGLAAWGFTPLHAVVGGEAERVEGQLVTGNYFSVLGASPLLGRTFTAEDEGESRPIALLGHKYWKRRFAEDPRAVGSSITINGHVWTIVGVTGAAFGGVDLDAVPDIWLPVVTYFGLSQRSAELSRRDSAWLGALGRLKSGVSLDTASAALDAVARRRASLRAPDLRETTAGLSRMTGLVPPGELAEAIPAIVLAGVVTGLVLLIACANVANLMLARSGARAREIGIREALGASRSRIVRMLLTESAVLGAIGAAAGLALASWGADLLCAYLGAPPGLSTSPDSRVLLYTLGLTSATALAFGLAPALRAGRDPRALLSQGRGEASSRQGSRLSGGLVAAQLALSLTLLVAAGLFLRSFVKANQLSIGLDRVAARRVVAVSFDLATQGYSEQRRASFFTTLLDRAAALPGVRTAALAETLPLGGRYVGDDVRPDPEAAGGNRPVIFLNTVSPGYFGTLGIRLVAGRDFRRADHDGAPGVAVVNEELARRFWPGQNPIGRRIHVGGEGAPALEVVGVAEDGKYMSLSERARPFLYLALLQRGARVAETILLVRTETPAATARRLREEVRRLDPQLPLYDVRTLADSLGRHTRLRRQAAVLLALLGGLAVLLASIGLYGLIAYAVSRRSREIGVRMALGAAPRDIVVLFLRRGTRLACIGVLAGLGISAGLTRLLSALLFGVTPTDAATFAGVTLLLGAVATGASWIPARRAANVDPMIALRTE